MYDLQIFLCSLYKNHANIALTIQDTYNKEYSSSQMSCKEGI